MSWTGFIVLLIVGFIIWGKISSKSKSVSRKVNRISGGSKRSSATQSSPKSIEEEAREIVDKITTLKQARGLEKRLEKAEQSLDEAETERAYESRSRKIDILQEALHIIGEKTLAYQFIPDVDLDTSKEILDVAYKVYSVEEYEELKQKYSEYDDSWFWMDMYSEKEEPEPYLNALKKLRDLLDDDISEDDTTYQCKFNGFYRVCAPDNREGHEVLFEEAQKQVVQRLEDMS